MDEKVDLRPEIERPRPDWTETDRPRPSQPGEQPPGGTPPGDGRRRRRGLGWLVVLLLLIGGGLLAWRLLHTGATRTDRRAGAGAAPQTVGTAVIATGDIDLTLQGLGAVTPIATVTVRTQINGQLMQLAFQEGQIVHKGDFLAQIDPRPYQVALEQAQGTLAHDTALLQQAQADNARYQQLNRQDSISRQQAQDQVFLIKQYQGQIVTDQAAIDQQKLNLIYCHIVSPVDGRIGIRMVDQGNYVQTSDTNGIVVVTQEQPMSVLFTLPEDNVAEIAKQAALHPLAVTAFDRANTHAVATGTLATMDNEIDPTTGTVKLRAMFPNTDDALFPQAFVNAHLLVETLHGVVIAPTTAVQTGAPGTFVYLVKPDDTVTIRVVKTGITSGDRVQVTSGLAPGDRVVTDGLDRLREGAKVRIADANPATPATPTNGAAPATAPATAPGTTPTPDNADTTPRRGRTHRDGTTPPPATPAPAAK